MSNVEKHNEKAWDKNVDDGIQWSVITSPESIDKARQGNFKF